MKLRLYMLSLLLAGFGLQSCDDDDDDNDRRVNPPAAVEQAFSNRYPGITPHEWELDYGNYKAEFRSADGLGSEAWFSPGGSWMGTETDYPWPLPQAVQDYLAAHYAGYHTDEVNRMDTPDAGSYFMIELERTGARDVYLRLRDDGTPVSPSDAGSGLPADTLPQAVSDYVAAHYAGYRISDRPEWVELAGAERMLELELESAGQPDVELTLTGSGELVSAVTDYYGALPQAVRDTLAARYPDYRTGDTDLVLTPEGAYYQVGLERAGQPDMSVRLGAESGAVSATATEYYGALPQPVQSWLTAHYATYRTDDADLITPAAGSPYYLLRLEHPGAPDVVVRITDGGTLVSR